MKISYGTSRFCTSWANREIAYGELLERLGRTCRTSETAAEFRAMPKGQRDDVKDVGGFVLGHLRDGRRRKGSVICRSGITLDADHADAGFADRLKYEAKYYCAIYSTHSHAPGAPRLRLVIPLARDVLPDEYAALSRFVADGLGMDFFDDSTYEPERLMYWPSTPSDGQFVFLAVGSAPLDPDEWLAARPGWRDCSSWPASSRQPRAIERNAGRKQDPCAKPGAIGAFCRRYTVPEAIARYLPSVYRPSAVPGRFDYAPADSSAGLVVYDGKWAYSHHATDPASGQLLSAFDLVRAHLFPDEDEKESLGAMLELAVADAEVNKLLLDERRQGAAGAPGGGGDWAARLRRDKGGRLLNTLANLTLILENDPRLAGIVFNQLADGMEITGEVPWKHPSRFWRDADDAQLVSYVDSRYGAFSARNYGVAVAKVVDDRSYHPIREYLAALPEWDGRPRVDALLVEWLGAEDSPYVRAVTRKTLCAAVERVYSPGVKFDHILVLNGEQGAGKSTLIARLGGAWYSDSLSLTDMNDKTAAEKLQGYWLLEIGELAGMRKADIDKVKAFISRQDDKYRASFGRRVAPHPRQCVFFGTTNSDAYLRDATGNRRFWTVRTPGGGARRTWQMTEGDVAQVWAEALCLANAGERLYLDADLEEFAKAEQREAMEQDGREGMVRMYLDMPLPEGWGGWDVCKRREYVEEYVDGYGEGDVDGNVESPAFAGARRETASNMEIWCECFGKRREDIEPRDCYAIAAIVARIGGWRKAGYVQARPYGKQRVYARQNN